MWWLLLLPCSLALHPLEPAVPPLWSTRPPQEHWLNVRLNHFDASNTETFPMRFYYKDDFFPSSSHVVVLVGGPWPIQPEWTQAGLAYEVASVTGAGLFYTEHRYYGQTRPSADTSVNELRYLTIDQALGDLAQFIQYIKSDAFENGRYKAGKVVLVGCSYAGSMATWMKLAYPHLIDGAFSDSGPLLAQEDFPEYLEIVNEALREQGGQACLSSVEESVSQLVALLDTPAGPASVSQMFNTCTTISATTPLDVATFFWFGVVQPLARLVQAAAPGDIPTACAALTTGSNDPVQRLAAWVATRPHATGSHCLESRYTALVAAYTNTSLDSEHSLARLWTYQTCVQYGWFQSTTSTRQPFLHTVPLEYFHQMCRDFFGSAFDEAFLRAGVERTNLLFAGLSHLPDPVVSAAGGLDPWAPLAPNATHATALAPVYYVPGVSQCRVIRPTGDSNIDVLEATKFKVMNHLAIYLTGYPLMISSASNKLSSIVLIVGVLSPLL